MASTILQLRNFAGRQVVKVIARHYSSALFIPGSKASTNFAYLTPYLDFDGRFADVDKLQKELSLRGIKIDADQLVHTWEFYKYIDANKWALESKRSETANRIKELKKKKNLSAEEECEKIQLITQAKVLKQDMKIIKDTLWEMEETVVVRALRLPNEIHEKTRETSIVLNSVNNIREPEFEQRKSHIDIGRDLGLLEYRNPINYYLCNDAAVFELAAITYVSNILAEADMIRVAGTDFSRSLVVEASGLDHEDPSETFLLSNNEGIDRETCNRLHLTGGASLASFLAMHTKQLINPNHFPLKYFATGRQYSPFVEGTTENGLFTVCQSSAVHTFIMVKDPLSEEYTKQFDDLLRVVSTLYDNLDVHYRIVMRSAGELQAGESLRISYEMWSANLRQYVEIGHISMCGQYFSKRLLIAYQTPTGRDFPAVISGTVLSVPKLLGCLLEEDPTKFRIPERIAENMLGNV